MTRRGRTRPIRSDPPPTRRSDHAARRPVSRKAGLGYQGAMVLSSAATTTLAPPVRLRPHHLLCMLTFIGEGYSPAFVAAYRGLVARLGAGATIEIVPAPTISARRSAQRRMRTVTATACATATGWRPTASRRCSPSPSCPARASASMRRGWPRCAMPLPPARSGRPARAANGQRSVMASRGGLCRRPAHLRGERRFLTMPTPAKCGSIKKNAAPSVFGNHPR